MKARCAFFSFFAARFSSRLLLGFFFCSRFWFMPLLIRMSPIVSATAWTRGASSVGLPVYSERIEARARSEAIHGPPSNLAISLASWGWVYGLPILGTSLVLPFGSSA
jgi:hypothetical protein